MCLAIAENPSFWLRGGRTGLVTAAVLKHAKGANSAAAFDKLAELVCNPEWKVLLVEPEEKPDADAEPENAQKKKKKAALTKKYISPIEKPVHNFQHTLFLAFLLISLFLFVLCFADS